MSFHFPLPSNTNGFSIVMTLGASLLDVDYNNIGIHEENGIDFVDVVLNDITASQKVIDAFYTALADA